MSITKRKEILLKQKPDLILSIHGNSDPTATARGFECYPSPPGRDNYDISYYFCYVYCRTNGRSRKSFKRRKWC